MAKRKKVGLGIIQGIPCVKCGGTERYELGRDCVACQRRRANERDERSARNRTLIRHVTQAREAPEAVMAERNYAYSFDAPTFGDPRPGRSALDRRRQA
jgi:hypothetical protein